LTKKKSPSDSSAVIYGVHAVLETLKAGKREIAEIFVSRGPVIQRELGPFLEYRQIPVTKVAADVLLSLCRSPHHQGIAAKVGPYPYVDLDEFVSHVGDNKGPVVLLDEIQDTSNLGSILRSGECLGAAGVILPKDRSVQVTPAVEKAAAGASAHIAVLRVVNIVRAMNRLKEIGYWTYAGDARSRETCFDRDLSGQVAFVLGSEGKGIRRLVKEQCDFGLSIPLAGRIESLNVAQSAAILLAEALRQRLARGHSNRCSK